MRTQCFDFFYSCNDSGKKVEIEYVCIVRRDTKGTRKKAIVAIIHIE
jgi:hypothetical protein